MYVIGHSDTEHLKTIPREDVLFMSNFLFNMRRFGSSLDGGFGMSNNVGIALALSFFPSVLSMILELTLFETFL